jgi:hypothetical protein
LDFFRRFSFLHLLPSRPLIIFPIALFFLLVLLPTTGCSILLNLANKAVDDGFKTPARKLYGTVAASSVSPITISSEIDGMLTETAVGSFELEYDQQYERWTGRSETVNMTISGKATTPWGENYVYEGSGVSYGDVWLTDNDDGTYCIFFSTGQIQYTRTSSTQTVNRHDCSFEMELMGSTPSDKQRYIGTGTFKDPDMKGTLGYEMGSAKMTWSFQPRPDENSVKIFTFEDNGLLDITDQTTDILVGEKVQLRAVPVLTDSSVEITDMTWEIGGLEEGIVIDDWIVQDNEPRLIHVASLDTPAVDYCWWDGTKGGQTQTVRHRITLDNGDIVEGETTFQVFEPDVTLHTAIGSIQVAQVASAGSSSGRLELLLLGDGAGMKFSGEIKLPDQFTGTRYDMQYVQRFKDDVYALYRWSNPEMEWMRDSSDDIWRLDDSYPYPSERDGMKQTTQDTPGAPFATFTAIHLEMYFETYFMFRPGNDTNIWVPLKQVNWGWQAYASMDKHPGTDMHVISNPDNYRLIREQVIAPVILDAQAYPDWTGVRPASGQNYRQLNPRQIVRAVDEWVPPAWKSP